MEIDSLKIRIGQLWYAQYSIYCCGMKWKRSITLLQWSGCLCPSNFTCWNPNPEVRVCGGGGFGRWWSREGQSPRERDWCPYKRGLERSLASSHLLRTQWHVCPLHPRRRSSSEPAHHWWDWHPYQRDPPENSLPFPPCEDTTRR